MKKPQRGLAVPLIATLIIVLAVGGVYLYEIKKGETPVAVDSETQQVALLQQQAEIPVETIQSSNDTDSASVGVLTSHKVSACGEIKKPGKYLLVADLINTKTEPCIKFQDVKNASLDCQNHTIISHNEDYNIYVKGSSDFKIKNCKLQSSVTLPSDRVQHVLRIEDSKRGEVSGSTIGGNFATVSGSTVVTLHNNTFTNQFSIYKSNHITITQNNFSNNIDPITLDSGSDNSVISNVIDGKSDGILHNDGNNIGADDGIVIKNESRDMIQGNAIKNVYDCGIETIGYMFDSKVISNSVKNAGVCLLGGWYWTSLKGNLIKDNVGDDMPRLFVFWRSNGLLSTEQYVYFKDNVFENNKFINPRKVIGNNEEDWFMEASYITMESSDVPSLSIPGSKIIIGNNVFKNNNFTTIAGSVVFSPVNMIVDGGGNICPATTDLNFPLKCN